MQPVHALIGAGSSGIAAAKALHERGLEFDCFELGDRVGGNWVFRNNNGVSSSYRSLHINTSRERMEYSDFPMPKSLPRLPAPRPHRQVLRRLRRSLRLPRPHPLRVGVEHVERRPDGASRSATTDGETTIYDAVVVANGHHWDPRWPEPAFPGSDTFEGEQMHSHYYEEESQLAGKDVVVLGMGNSAMDIAVDASYHATNTYLAARRGAHIVPKYLFGKPMDQVGGAEWIPAWIRFPIMSFLLKMNVGKMENYGLPEPDHKFAHAHPTVSGPHPRPARPRRDHAEAEHRTADGEMVIFTDGTRGPRRPRRLLHGLQDHVPVLRRGLRRRQGERAALYQFMFHPSTTTSSSSGSSSRSGRSCRSPSASRS